MVGHIKLHRRILDWEWFDDEKTFRLFIYLLLKANWKPKPWKNIDIKRGQLATSVTSLSQNLGYTSSEIRSRLSSLTNSKEISTQTTNRFTVITICKYEDYQPSPDDESQTNRKHSDKQIATTKEDKKKEYKDKRTRKKHEGSEEAIIKKNKEIYITHVGLGLDKDYANFVKFLFGDNELDRQLDKCLAIPDDPITPRIFNNLINKHSKTLVADKVLGIETYKDSTTSVSRRLSVWCRKDKEEKNKLNP